MEGTTNETMKEFQKMYPAICRELLNDFERLSIGSSTIIELQDYHKELLDYTLPGGKLNRGVTVVRAFEAAKLSQTCDKVTDINGDEVSDEAQRYHAIVLGWCVEFLQAFFLTADDIMDHSHKRRGKPCWFRQPHVTATNAINDSLFLESCIYRIMKKYLGLRKEYAQLLDLVHQMSYNTVVGQHLDTNAQSLNRTNPVDLSRVTMERYQAIVKYKTAYYSYYMPCAAGLILGGRSSDAMLGSCEKICMALGEYFQVQDDYLDCFADAEELGKIGTDIEERKCTWLLVKMMEVATEEECRTLVENYGFKNPENVKIVKDLYNKYNLQEKYNQFENTAYENIKGLSQEFESTDISELFEYLLHQIYRRRK